MDNENVNTSFDLFCFKVLADNAQNLNDILGEKSSDRTDNLIEKSEVHDDE
jgi:hypothetical protein